MAMASSTNTNKIVLQQFVRQLIYFPPQNWSKLVGQLNLLLDSCLRAVTGRVVTLESVCVGTLRIARPAANFAGQFSPACSGAALWGEGRTISYKAELSRAKRANFDFNSKALFVIRIWID
jgi:hypothetical protein